MKIKKNFYQILTVVVVMMMMIALGIAGCTTQQSPEGTENQNGNDSTVPGQMEGDNTIEGTYDSEKVSAVEEAIEELPEVNDAYVVLSNDTAWVALDLDGMLEDDDGMLEDNDGILGDGAINDNGAGTPGTTPGSTDTTDNAGTSNIVTDNMANDDNMNGDMAGQGNVPEDLKMEITETIQSMYSEINTVYVTADRTFVDRIQQIADDIASGRAINEFSDDLTDIGDEIM